MFQTFWHGSALSAYEQTCMRSFLDHGHRYVVYTYTPDLKVPADVEIRDAAPLIAPEEYFVYGPGPGAGSHALFSNLFRYKLLAERGGWWVDTDVVCLSREIPQCEIFCAYQESASINGAVLRLPKGHPIAHHAYERSLALREQAQWGQVGPELITQLIQAQGLADVVRPMHSCYPIHWTEALELLCPSRTKVLRERVRGALFLHLWNEMFRRQELDKNKLPPAGSLLREIFDRYPGSWNGEYQRNAFETSNRIRDPDTTVRSLSENELIAALREEVAVFSRQLTSQAADLRKEALALSAEILELREERSALAAQRDDILPHLKKFNSAWHSNSNGLHAVKTATIEFSEYLVDPPLLHSWDDGRTWNQGGLSPDHLQLIHDLASAVSAAHIIETGAGNSSITFLFAGPARLVSVESDAGVLRRTQEYCIKAGINASRWDPIVELSEIALPKLFLSKQPLFDIALIDGCHGMPTVFVDFVYMHALLKVGGLLLIKDVQLHSAKELARLLAKEPGFTLLQQMEKLVVIRKEWDRRFIGDFGNQHYLLERNARYATWSNPFALVDQDEPSYLFYGKFKFGGAHHFSNRLAKRVSNTLYQSMRLIYRALPIRADLKRKWANAFINHFLPYLLKNSLINHHHFSCVKKLAALPINTFDDQFQSGLLRQKTLVIEHRLPTPDRTSASVRLAALLKLIRQMGREVIFISDSEKHSYKWILDNIDLELPRYEDMLSKIGITVFYGFDAAVELLIKEGLTYDTVILSYPEIMYRYAPLIRAFAPKAQLIYDTVDLHGLRFSREAVISDKDKKQELITKADYYEHIERAGFKVADKVIAITPEEAQQIVLRCPEIRKPIVIPNIHASSANIAPIEGRSGLLFIGHYLHTPNEDAVSYFVKDIFPLIESEIPDIKFDILGSSITDKIRSLKNEKIRPVGYVQDPERYFSRARVFVAPLRYGAGMKGKIGQALSLGLPIVSTSIGVEGMGLLNECHVLVADDAQAFASAVVRLYKDDCLWKNLSGRGRDYVHNNFSESAIEPAVYRLLKGAPDAVTSK